MVTFAMWDLPSSLERGNLRRCKLVGFELTMRGTCAGDDTQQFINSNVGNQLLRMAIQKTIGDLSLAHKLWEMLVEQVSAQLGRHC